jgi:hypothetical protein
LGGTDGEGSVGGDIFFHTEKWGPPAALSALLFLLGVFFLRQIFVSRSDEKIGNKATSKGGFGFVRSLIRFIRSLNLGMNG